MLGYLEQFRRIATRYDKTALSLASFLNLAANPKWLQLCQRCLKGRNPDKHMITARSKLNVESIAVALP